MANNQIEIRAITVRPHMRPREVTETVRPGERLGAEGFINVVWEHWRITQSEFHYRPAGEVDLGEISGEPVFPLDSKR